MGALPAVLRFLSELLFFLWLSHGVPAICGNLGIALHLKAAWLPLQVPHGHQLSL
jgi:hypothetical protein